MQVICNGKTDHDEWSFAVGSESTPGLFYEVCLWPSRPAATCECLDWSCRRRTGNLNPCKHVRAVLEWIESEGGE